MSNTFTSFIKNYDQTKHLSGEEVKNLRAKKVLPKVLLLFGLNLLDALLTVFWVETKIATEGNALMDNLMGHGTYYFLFFKLLIGAMCILVFYKMRFHKSAQFGLSAVIIVYALLMCFHFSAFMKAISPFIIF